MRLFWGRLLRPGLDSSRDVTFDFILLACAAALLVATGIGMRDPWPADEPRFALIARDMVASGEWFIPRIGGDVYADKPPLFFWAVASLLVLTGSLRSAFLLPSLLAAVGSVLLIYDIARRLWTRELALGAALLLLFTVQFIWQARQAQIDAFLCFWTTLSLYSLLRHLLLGPAWGWYAIGWAAAGLGIISKGVGFLPLLILIPYLILRAPRWSPRPPLTGGWRWSWGPLALLAAVFVWLLPMLWFAHHDPQLASYRDEILFDQTVERYTRAWQHNEPFWYFLLEVIPVLWLPLSALLPWLLRPWRQAWRAGDLRVVLPLLWASMVVVFFSLSSGKRGVYVLPAVPAMALACAPFLPDLLKRLNVQRALFGTVAALAVLLLAGSAWLVWVPAQRQRLIHSHGIDPFLPVFVLGAVVAAICLLARPRRGALAFAATVASVLMLVSVWVSPLINDARSGRSFVQRVVALVPAGRELGVVDYKEQYLLYLHGPVVNFGHGRWHDVKDAQQEMADAAAWLAADDNRVLLVSRKAVQRCFASADVRSVGAANRKDWFLVSGAADPKCTERGNLSAARSGRSAIRAEEDPVSGRGQSAR